ncbi:MAG: exodeoxyribonuclease III [Burkholderiaceae bacterium]
MKIATWNVNSLSVRLPQVLAWLQSQAVDVLALQELKLTDDKFPHEAFAALGYQSECFGQKTYNGVALLSRYPLRDTVRNIPGLDDEQARVIAATAQTPEGPVRVVNGYFVNGQAPGTDKFAYKMRWLEALHAWLRGELAQHPALALVGDFNVAPEDRDSYDPEGLRETIHHTSEERQHFKALLALGLTDAFRCFEQPDKSFSWWDYRMLGFQKNRGLRIDHILVSPPLRERLTACSVDRAPRKNPQPSDHAPVVAHFNLETAVDRLFALKSSDAR